MAFEGFHKHLLFSGFIWGIWEARSAKATQSKAKPLVGWFINSLSIVLAFWHFKLVFFNILTLIWTWRSYFRVHNAFYWHLKVFISIWCFLCLFEESGKQDRQKPPKAKPNSWWEDSLVSWALSLHFGMLNLCFSLFYPWFELKVAILGFIMPFSGIWRFS